MTDNRTTELREKLTERGVKWSPMCNNGYYEDRDTEFVANGKKHTAHEWGDGLAVYNLTPEQAIAATLGAGECELVETESYSNANEVIHVLECSACGKTCEHVNGSYTRCPHCGRMVKR